MQLFLEAEQCNYFLVYRLHPPFCLDTSHSPTLHLHACCLFSDTLPQCLVFVHSFLTGPSDPSLQPSSTTLRVLSPWRSRMSSASPIHLLLTTAIAVYGNQERAPFPESSWISSLQAVEVAVIIIRVVSLTSTGKAFWEGQPAPLRWAWHPPQRKRLAATAFLEEENNLNSETDCLRSAF